MNQIRLRYLMIEPKLEFLDELEMLLACESLFCEGGETAKSLNDGLQSLSTNDFDLCFIGECFGTKQLADFFNDTARIARSRECVFVYVRQDPPKIPADGVPPHSRIQSVIARRAERETLKPLIEKLAGLIVAKEAQWRINEIEKTLAPLFGELDLIASERKRGMSKDFSRVASQYIQMLAGAEPNLFAQYFESLTTKSAEAMPAVASGGNTPLSETEQGSYKGVSARVWRKMQQAQLAKQSSTLPLENQEDSSSDSESALSPASDSDETK